MEVNRHIVAVLLKKAHSKHKHISPCISMNGKHISPCLVEGKQFTWEECIDINGDIITIFYNYKKNKKITTSLISTKFENNDNKT